MRLSPPGWPRLSSALYYDDPLAAIDWLVAAFGFAVRVKIMDDGRLVHSELTLDEAVVMVASAHGDGPGQSPRALDGANTQSLALYIDEVDDFTARAEAAGAVVLKPPTTTDYGPEWWSDRSVELADPEGHRWWFMQRLRTG